MFRPEVIEAKRTAQSTGRVVLKNPAIVTWMVACVGAVTLAIVLLLVFGQYAKRADVTGTLQPDRGLVKVLPPQPGQILTRNVTENQHVRAGDVLFTLSSERTTNLGATGAAAMLALRERQASLSQDLVNLGRQQADQLAANRRRLADLQAQLGQMGEEIVGQQRRVDLAQTAYGRYQQLGRENFMPALQVQEKADELLDQQGRLSALKRAQRELQSQIGSVDAEIAAEPLKDASQKGEVERNITALRQDLATTEAQREVRITAPIAGTVVAIQAEPGQSATGSEPLAAIIPDGSSLVAYFYAPSSAIGFVRPGQDVHLRYQPYPYQKFGQHAGIVTEVSRSAVKAVPASVVNPSGEALYRITVKPAEQTILAYGRQEALQPDMAVEADVLTDRRRLIEWIFEPLLSIKGKLG